MPISIVISYLIGYLPIVFGQAMLIEVITKHKRRVSVKFLVVAYVVCYLLQAGTYFLVPTDIPGAIYINMLFTVAPLMIISVCLYQGKALSSMLAVGAAFMIAVTGESLAGFLVCAVSGMGITELLQKPNLVAVGTLLSGVITTSTLLLVAFVCSKVQKNKGYLSRPYLKAILLTVTSSIVMTYSVIHTVMSDKSMQELQALIIVATLVCINFFVMLLYRRMVKDTENRYRNLFSDTPAGVCVLDADEQMNVLIANKTFYKIMGIVPKGKKKGVTPSLFELLDGNTGKQLKTQWLEMQSSHEKNFENELLIMQPDGKTRTILASVFYDRDNTNQMTVNVLDITRRKQMEEQLSLLEQEYQIAVQMTKRCVLLYDIAAMTARQLPGITGLLDFSAEMTNFPQMLLDLNIVSPSCRDSYNTFFGAILQGKTNGTAYFQMKATGSDEYRWYIAEFATVYGSEHEPYHAIIAISDAQEQHENELAYKRMQQSAAEIPDTEYKLYERNLTKDVIENENGAAFASPESILKGRGQEGILYLIDTHVRPEDQEKFISFISRERLLDLYKHGQASEQMELQIISFEKKLLWFSVQIQLVEDSFSSDIKAYYLLRNINDQKQRDQKVLLDMNTLKAELENSRIRIMMNQMQPHFLYNALSSIRAMIKVEPDYAYDLMHDFTVHLRSSVKALQNDAPIPFEDELKNIRAYLNIEKMRMGERLTVQYDIQCESFNVVPLSIQPLAENAARHGIYPLGEKGGTVVIRSYETQTAYVVEISDNGAGFNVNEVLNCSSESVGLKNLIFRLKSLMNADVSVCSAINNGTRVAVTIPKEK